MCIMLFIIMFYVIHQAHRLCAVCWAQVMLWLFKIMWTTCIRASLHILNDILKVPKQISMSQNRKTATYLFFPGKSHPLIPGLTLTYLVLLSPTIILFNFLYPGGLDLVKSSALRSYPGGFGRFWTNTRP